MKSYLHKIEPLSPLIRCWPYPYLAGLSLSNDAEFMSFDFFDTLMKFLNTKTLTPLGKGLGLDISSSFFFYSAHPYNFSYFDGHNINAPCKDYYSRINEYLQSGWLDTIHAYGDFDTVGGFSRAHAIRCFDILANIGVSIPIFTNHGGVENIQNIGRDALYHQGDIKHSQAYHADLLAQHGIRYVWTDSMLTQQIEKQRINLRLRLSLIKKSILKKKMQKNTAYFIESNDISCPIKLQDESIFIGFQRFRSTGKNAPNLSSLAYQLHQIPWSDFYKYHMGIIFYQHFGVIYRNAGKCFPATIDAIKEHPETYLTPFYFLKNEKISGKLWIASLESFLNYVSMIRTTTVTQEVDGVYCLHNENLKNCFNVMEAQKYYMGLTIYIDPSKSIQIKSENKKLKIDYNGPDEMGRYSCTVSFLRKNNIWL
ncbi:hypothetical protein L3556_03385 [Candidatus Synechococcus calcipolaris G9]|uniref:Uncharacterized protein n=1 Tax=Candidatus Synechococcus calcipolaris G9 TaxID=1497997 RepID=A0ABT6EW22_9SYNE|nr:hypothetical protein [Candidatus Synechococcus calcipolaris]MDG2989980.1 hypothetical protein [Candidatus Synechococcus calcipolaris G9]